MNILEIDQIKDLIQTSHINFLFGSGLSSPFLHTLNSIEKLLTESQNLEDNIRKIVEASLFAEYFKTVMEPCLCENLTIKHKEDYNLVIESYKNFLRIWNAILANRDTSLLDKTINIFTTNIDNLLEKSAEAENIEFNDGFKGHFRPIFREDSFNNILTKISPLYQNIAHIPVFNYIKIHGSINWIELKDQPFITYDNYLELIKKIKESYFNIPIGQLLEIKKEDTIESLNNRAKEIILKKNNTISDEIIKFLRDYSELIMIHPRKSKFKESVIDSHFYELMRIYSNSLEKSNSLMFVFGFSFADEHIAKITVRAANTNPTLQIIIFAYSESDKSIIENNIKTGGTAINNNISIISAREYYRIQKNSEKELIKQKVFELINNFQETTIKVSSKKEDKTDLDISKDFFFFNLQNINYLVFDRILELI